MNRRDFCKVAAIAPVACVLGPQRSDSELGIINEEAGNYSIIYDVRTEFPRKLFHSMLESLQTLNARRFMGKSLGCVKIGFDRAVIQRDYSTIQAILCFEWRPSGFDLRYLVPHERIVSYSMYDSTDFSQFFPWCDSNDIPWIGK